MILSVDFLVDILVDFLDNFGKKLQFFGRCFEQFLMTISKEDFLELDTMYTYQSCF